MDTITVTLPSGNLAVYEEPAAEKPFIGPSGALMSNDQRARLYGRQLAHELDGVWYSPGTWTRVADPRVFV